ncbi:MAG: GntR family transcriptional regulator [Spirochaetes bacterium]|nr:GntR family transcriptional regulator [Spirochaetota bacterium]
MKRARGRPPKRRPRPKRGALPPAPPSERALQVRHYLAGEARAGRLTAGTPIPSARDLARTLGVSLNTVTKAFGLLRQDGVLAGEKGRGTYLATTLTRGTVLLIHNRFREGLGPLSLFTLSLDRSVELLLEKAGYQVALCPVAEDGSEIPRIAIMDRLATGRFDFAVDVGSGRWHGDFSRAVQKAGLAMYAILPQLENPLHRVVVGFDLGDFRRKALEVLGPLGVRRPLWLHRASWVPAPSGDRPLGNSSDAKIIPVDAPLPIGGDLDGGAAMFDKALDRDGSMDGAVVENDVWAEVLQTRLLHRGLKIPLVVMANRALPRHFALPVTRIFAPRENLGDLLSTWWAAPTAGNPKACRIDLPFSAEPMPGVVPVG